MKKYHVLSKFFNFKFGFKGKRIVLDKGHAVVEVEDKDVAEFEALFKNNPAITPYATLAKKDTADKFSEVVEKQAANSGGTTLGALASNNLMSPKDPILEAFAAAGAEYSANEINKDEDNSEENNDADSNADEQDKSNSPESQNNPKPAIQLNIPLGKPASK